MITFGFFDSVSDDRLYSSTDFGEMFDGVITEGIFRDIGDTFSVESYGGLQISVGTGRAWLNRIWVKSNATEFLNIDPGNALYHRYDAVIIDVDSSPDVRAVTLKVLKGDAVDNPAKPTLVNTEVHSQHALAYIYVRAGATVISQGDIENRVGFSDMPFVTAPLEKHSVDTLFSQWGADFHDWFETIKGNLGEDPAGSLQNQIYGVIDAQNTLISRMNVKPNTSILYNSLFRISQRTGGSYTYFYGPLGNSGVFIVDRWRLFRGPVNGQLGNFAASLHDDQYGRHGILITRNVGDTNTEPIKLVQDLPFEDSISLRGLQVRFSVEMGLESSPSGDSPDIDVVLSIVSGEVQDQNQVNGYTNMNTVLTKTVRVTGTGETFHLAAVDMFSGTIPMDSKQVGVCIEILPSNTPCGPNPERLFIRKTSLWIGTVFEGWDDRTFDEDLLRCQRFYQKSFSYQQFPSDVNLSNRSIRVITPITLTGGRHIGSAVLSPEMYPRGYLGGPTITLYNPGESNGENKIWNKTDFASVKAGIISSATNGFSVSLDASNSCPAGKELIVEWVADSEF